MIDVASGATAAVSSALADAADSTPATWWARFGLAARGTVYLLIGALCLLLVRGATAVHTDQKGAFAQLLSYRYGTWLVAALAVGFAGYALWRTSEAAFGVAGHGRATWPRVMSAGRAIGYLALTGTAISALRGSRTSQADTQSSLVEEVMAHTGGRWLVAIAGVGLAAAGVLMIVEGARLRFLRYLKGLPTQARPLVVNLGRIGTIGRGVVFAGSGLLVVIAAWQLRPDRAGGFDVAIRTALGQPYGGLLVTLAGLALIAFGLYGLAEARYRRV